ncbi:hypothetical protein SASPL_121418 [Salvia splendens]|uniref:Calcium permeable stress-gated cation channel 1 n=1 Tax=Salvia splendens TaxID=180675 RepID=A0A8X8ZW28_SALSN|nr:hypothetical protein SASPL_121418 [Salvia splendens]
MFYISIAELTALCGMLYMRQDMATFGDIGVAAAFNILSALIFLIAFAFLRLQPFNDRVYFPKWYLKGLRSSPSHSGTFVTKIVNLDWRAYIRFLNWVPEALKMPEPELIDHAGLDSAAYLRIYLLGYNCTLYFLDLPLLKIFVPVTLLSWAILVPVNWTNNTLAVLAQGDEKITFSNIDKLSISNVPHGSPRFCTHVVMAYVFTFWTCYTLMKEYEIIAAMRLHFLASEKRRPVQFTVLVRNVPPDPDESVSECVEHFFLVNHPDHYLTHQVVINANKLAKLVEEKKKKENWLDYYQLKYSRNQAKRPMTKTGFLGLCGDKVDGIDYQTAEIERLTQEIEAERERVKTDPNCIMPTAFVSFKTRWGAAVCAQTQQSRNPTLWLTEWAAEPRDVFWANLAIPYVSITIRKLIAAVAFFFLTFFFMIPVSAVQSLANIESIEKRKFIKSFIQGVLPGLALKIFLIVLLPTILMMMSKFEGFLSISALERRAALRYYLFNFVNVFLLHLFRLYVIVQCRIPETLGVAIPMKATFFITYVMVDGWAGIAGEILRLKPLIFFHLKNFFLVKTEKDREEAMDPGSIGFNTGEPQIQLYFLLGLVYAVVTPIFLPFILVFFALAYMVFRHATRYNPPPLSLSLHSMHLSCVDDFPIQIQLTLYSLSLVQIINVYNQEYESAAAFWPDVHGLIIYALIFSQIVLMGLMGRKVAMTKKAQASIKPGLSMRHVLCLGWKLVILLSVALCVFAFLRIQQYSHSTAALPQKFRSLTYDFNSNPKNVDRVKFSIYVHSEPGFVFDESTTRSTVFFDRQLRNSIKVAWGEASMIQAERILFEEALQDPANQRFVLLSDSCVPLYNFSYIYNYLMGSPRSFVDSFLDKKDVRYNPQMSPAISKQKWRKGSKWVTLIRRHAEEVDDETVFPIFEKFCKRRPPVDASKGRKNLKLQKQHNCIPDEHYFQTLLSMKDLENELERRTVTYTVWNQSTTNMDNGGWHPFTFSYADAGSEQIKKIKDINHVYYETEYRTEW